MSRNADGEQITRQHMVTRPGHNTAPGHQCLPHVLYRRSILLYFARQQTAKKLDNVTEEVDAC